MKKIAIIGAGGFGQEVFCIWRDILNTEGTEYEFIGFFDDKQVEKKVFGDVIGSIEDLNSIIHPLEVAIAIGTPKTLQMIRNKLTNNNLIFPNIIHPSCLFLDQETVTLGNGNIISLNVIISCNVKIGDFNVFNTRATLGHDDSIGSYNVLSPNTQISGNVEIGNCNFFGFNSGIIQGKKIGDNNVIGVGAIALRTIKDDGIYIGNPAVRFKL